MAHAQVTYTGSGAVNFGSLAIGTTSAAKAMTFTFSSGATVGSIQVVTQGATGLDFTDAGTGTCQAGTAYSAGASCTVGVTFKPGYPGTRYGAAKLWDSTGNLLATVNLQGAGVGPLVNFLPGTQSTVRAGLYAPEGLTVDASGNVYISDSQNNRVLKETPSGGGYTETTVGSGLFDPLGLAVDGSGDLYICDFINHRVVKETLASSVYTQTVFADQATNGLSYNDGVAVDSSGNVYISDTGNHRILKETPSASGYTQSTIVSGSYPYGGIVVDPSGNLYALKGAATLQIVKETPSTGGYIESVVVSGNGVSDPAVDGSGNVYVANQLSNGVEIIRYAPHPDGSYTQTVLSTLAPFAAYAIAVDKAGNVFIINYPFEVLKEDFADPPSLVFAATTLGQTSTDSPQTITVENAGNSALTFPIPSAGNNPGIDSSNFTLDSSVPSACPLLTSGSPSPATLAPGSGCQLAISFTPGLTVPVGNLSGSLSLTDDSLNAPLPNYAKQGIQLNGTAAYGPGALVSPPPGSRLGTHATFSWTPGYGPTQYELTVGTTGPGSSDLFSSGPTVLTSATVPTLPTVGGTIYAQLGSYLGGAWQYANYTYTESVPASLTAPMQYAVLGSSANFTWSPGTGVTEYALWLGTHGFGSYDLYNSGHTTALSSGSVSLPTNNVAIYAMLFSYVGGEWLYSYYTFFEGGPAAIESPAPGSVLGLAANFVWSPGTGATMSSLALGTGGPGSSNLYNSGPTTATTAYVLHLPSNSGTVNARLGSYNGTAWSYTDYTYTAAAPYGKATLLSPTPGVVVGTSVNFTWSAGTGVTNYALWVGTTPGGHDLYNSGHTTALVSGTVALPSNDVPIYVTLFSYVGGEWLYSTYTFIEAGPAKMLSPAPGIMLGFNAIFNWTPGTGGTMSSLALGTTGVGSNNLYNLGPTAANSTTVSGLPNNSATIYARLGSYNGTAWTYTDYIYTESPPAVKAVLVSPSPAQGATLGTTASFAWSPGTDVTQYALWLGTHGFGSYDLYNSGHTTGMSTGTIPVPANGVPVYGQLWSYINGVWQYTLYNFTEQ